MLVLLPLAVMVSMYSLVRLAGTGLCQGIVSAFCATSLAAVVMVETLSLIGLINRTALAVAWSVLLLLCLFKRLRCRSIASKEPLLAVWSRLGLGERCVVFGIAGYMLVLLWIALSFPPNNWDSLTYHMARVQHWAQNGQVTHYPTSIDRQLYQPPLAEFLILNLHVLSGSDRLANIVQWSAAFASVFCVAGIAARFKVGRGGQMLAAAVSLTIPMAILQASSTQNDYVLGLWLCSVMLWLPLDRFERTGVFRGAWLGALAGMALLTKGTAPIYLAPWLAWYVGILVMSEPLGRVWKVLAVTVAICVLLNAGHWWRNYLAFGSPLGAESVYYVNSSFGAHSLVSNLLRDGALHLSTPSTTLCHLVANAVAKVHNCLGWSVHEPGLTFMNTKFTLQGALWNHEDHAGCITTALLAIACMGALILVRRLRTEVSLVMYLAGLWLGFAVFCVVLRWQPWHSRLHLPLFMLASPWIAVVLWRWGGSKATWLGPVLLVVGLPWLLLNHTRPVVNRQDTRARCYVDWCFRNAPNLGRHYHALGQQLVEGQFRSIGLQLGGDDWEYPIWLMLRREGRMQQTIRHVNVKGRTEHLANRPPWAEYRPEVIIDSTAINAQEVTCKGIRYGRIWHSGDLDLYMRQ